MVELFDYGSVHVPASFEVAWYEIEQEHIMSVDWRLRASNHFRKSEAKQSRHDFPAALGALSLGLSKDRIIKQRVQEINELEAMLQEEHYGPDD